MKYLLPTWHITLKPYMKCYSHTLLEMLFWNPTWNITLTPYMLTLYFFNALYATYSVALQWFSFWYPICWRQIISTPCMPLIPSPCSDYYSDTLYADTLIFQRPLRHLFLCPAVIIILITYLLTPYVEYHSDALHGTFFWRPSWHKQKISVVCTCVHVYL